MKNKIIFSSLIIIPFICCCSSNKQINKETALKRANNYDLETLDDYENNVSVENVFTISASGAFSEDGDLYNSLPQGKTETTNENKEIYFYDKQKIEDLDLSIKTSNGVETSYKLFAYLDSGLIIEKYAKIKTSSSGIPIKGYEKTLTYILDDGRVEKVLFSSQISVQSDKDDFQLTGEYSYNIDKNITWIKK